MIPNPNGYHAAPELKELAAKTETYNPYSQEAEQATLGAILIDSERLYDVKHFLQPADFFIVRNAWVYESLLSLQDKGDTIDVLTVSDDLEGRGRLAECGGAAYLLSLMSHTPAAYNCEAYARIVERMATRRRLIEAGTEVVRLAHSEDMDIDTINEKAEAAVYEVTRKSSKTEPTMREIAMGEYERTVTLMRGGEVDDVMTGLTDLDRHLGGLEDGDLMLVAGRPGMGKTSLLASSARRRCMAGEPTALFSCEMGLRALFRRFLVMETGIPYADIRRGKIPQPQIEVYENAHSAIGGQWPLHLFYTPALTPAQFEHAARKLAYEDGVRLFMVDYLGLMSPGAAAGNLSNRNQELGYISRTLKQIAGRLEIVILAAHQLNRNVEKQADKRPGLSDLRDSGELEQDGDIIGLLYDDSYYNPDTLNAGVVELNIAKYRNGATGVIKFAHQPVMMRFDDLAPPIDLYDDPPAARRVYGQE